MHIKHQGPLLLHIIFEFRDSGIGQNCVQFDLIRIILGQSFWNSIHLFIIAIVRSYVIFVYMGATSSRGGGNNTPGEWRHHYKFPVDYRLQY